MIYKFYTDGAATMNKVNGEWVREAGAWAWAWVDNDMVMDSACGDKALTTNNEQELMAIYMALERCKSFDLKNNDTIEICSDSSYCIDIFTSWIEGWIKRGWKRAKNKPIENLKLIQRIWANMEKFKEKSVEIKFTKVKGHGDDVYNIFVDKIAVETKQRILNGLTLEKKDDIIDIYIKAKINMLTT